jgi:hypothetical protein
VAAVGACSSGPPDITQQFVAEVVRFDPRTAVTSRNLGVFAVVDDPDGLNDIDRMWIVSDQTQTLWELAPENWENLTIAGNAWLGSSRLLMPVGEALPRGNLRIQVEDRGGSRVEANAALGQTETIAAKPPMLSYSANTLHVDQTEQDRVELSVRDWSDNEISKSEITAVDIPLVAIAASRNIADLRFYLYSFSTGLTRISVSGPWIFKP